ncbi:MAG TPA: UdgX family uracil-DNA binding protein [Caldimonas sp.]|nr:UdgX family uracil-DNA binding protein [Caldimonas sp.]
MQPHEDAPYAPPAASAGVPANDAGIRGVTLAAPTDLAGFRRACRSLWSAQIAPERVVWRVAGEPRADLFETEPVASTRAAPPVRVPAAFLAQCESAILHNDAGRFGLLYRLLWRLQIEPALRHDALDADRVAVDAMAQAVRRDMHAMQAQVRFSRVASDAAASPTHVAWYAPEHHIVEATAPLFAQRFSQLRWVIATPDGSVRWDGQRLHFGKAARRDQWPSVDADESAWRVFCQALFARTTDGPDSLMSDVAPGSSSHAMRPQPLATKSGPATPASLGALVDALQRCRECPIGEFATQAVPGEGSRHARLMFVGEQPGDQEDLQGRPFVGPAGQLFDRALADLDIDRRTAYVTNAVKHFKFELRGKRRIHKTPAQQEAAACLHWLETEIALVDPGAIVALGATAARQLMGTAVAVTRQRGRWLKRPDGRQVLVTLHPSALLRMDPQDKDDAYGAWLADLRKAADRSRP